MLDVYKVRVMNSSDVEMVRTCLKKMGFEVKGRKSGNSVSSLEITGPTDMTPSQVEMTLRAMGCASVSVKDGYGRVSDVDTDDINTLPEPKVMVDMNHGHLDFDVETANDLLSQMVGNIYDMMPEDGDAEYDQHWYSTPEAQNFSEYLNSIVDDLVVDLGMDDDDAVNALTDCADECFGKGMLPKLPEGDSMDSDYTTFVGKAKSIGFAGLVKDRVA